MGKGLGKTQLRVLEIIKTECDEDFSYTALKFNLEYSEIDSGNLSRTLKGLKERGLIYEFSSWGFDVHNLKRVYKRYVHKDYVESFISYNEFVKSLDDSAYSVDERRIMAGEYLTNAWNQIQNRELVNS